MDLPATPAKKSKRVAVEKCFETVVTGVARGGSVSNLVTPSIF